MEPMSGNMRPVPRQVIRELYPEIDILPISGGWGMEQEDACIIDKNDPAALPGFAFDSLSIIETYVEKFIYIRLINARDDGDSYCDISWKLGQRKTIVENDRIYEVMQYDISAIPEAKWECLKKDWEDGQFVSDFDIKSHIQQRNDARHEIPMYFWFDVTSCFSCSLFGIDLPWAIGDFLRGAITDYESQQTGLGYSVAYNRINTPCITSTIYLYSHGHDDIPGDLQDESVVDYFKFLLEDIQSVNQNNLNQQCELKNASFFGAPDAPPLYLYAEFDVISDEDRNKTMLYLRTHDGRFLKIRQTLPEDEKSQEFGFQFAAQFADILTNRI